MVIGREVDARRAVGLHVVGRAIRAEGHGPFPFGQAWKPDDDDFVSNVDHRPRGPRVTAQPPLRTEAPPRIALIA